MRAQSEIDNIIGVKFEALDKGFVRVVDYMGNDSSVVQAARVSYGEGTKRVNEDKALIDYLMRHQHMTPLEMTTIKFHIKCPIFVARQWFRHRTGSFNEISARYTEVKDEFYSPEISNIKPQSKTNHQGREESESFDIVKALDYQISMKDCSTFDYEIYQMLINDGVAKEIARTVLPVSQYTEFYWSLNLRNLFHFLHLRSDSHAQYEIRVYADIISSLVETWVPHCFEAFQKYQLGAKTLSAPAIKMLQKMATTGETTPLEESGMGKREYQDFLNLLKGN
jgi:thymidylate synthase (FAD)